MEKIINNRDISLDVIRTCAILFVLGVHSFSTPHKYCFLQSILRTISVLGVPLFLILSGYLTSNKTIDAYYIDGKWKTFIYNYIAYFFLGSICFLTPCIVFQDNFNILDYLFSILNFTCTPYGWYMEMWIGLFFITPFLNIILNNINKKNEISFIITLISISQFASFINRNGNIFIPSYWQSLWPISLFVIGHFIKKYEIKVKSKLVVLFIIILPFEYLLNKLFVTNNYIYFYGGHNMIVYMFMSVLLFLLLRNINNIKQEYIRKIFIKCSQLSFFMYLISATFDKTLFRILEPQLYKNEEQFLPYRICIYIVTIILSFFSSWIYLKIDYKIKKII